MDGVAEALAKLVADELAQPVSRLGAPASPRRSGAARARAPPPCSSTAPACASAATPACSTSTCSSTPTAPRTRGARSLSRMRCFRPTCSTSSSPARAGVLRAKYAVVSLQDFQRGAAGRWLRTGIWARFAQPVRAVYLRDDHGASRRRRRLRRVGDRAARAHASAAPGRWRADPHERGGALADRLPRDLRGGAAARVARRDPRALPRRAGALRARRAARGARARGARPAARAGAGRAARDRAARRRTAPEAARARACAVRSRSSPTSRSCSRPRSPSATGCRTRCGSSSGTAGRGSCRASASAGIRFCLACRCSCARCASARCARPPRQPGGPPCS